MIAKIISALITLSILVFLITSTYINNVSSDFKKPFYEKTKIGLFELNKIENDDSILFSLDEISKSNTGKIFVKKINISDKIIFQTGSIKIEENNDNLIINIGKGIYFFDLKELNKTYIIKGNGFEIKNKGSGNFFINNLNTTRNVIFSINTLLDLKLKNIKNNEDIINIDLFPNVYLIFNPNKNFLVKSSDLLKVSQIFTLGYLKESIIQNNIISEKFTNLISLKNLKYNDFINNSLLFIKQESETAIKITDTFIKKNIGIIKGENLINFYFQFFINENKKNIYLKNIIIKNLHDLLISKKLNYQKFNIIIDNLEHLKLIDNDGYNEIIDIITYHYKAILQSNNNTKLKIFYSELLLKINNKKLNKNSISLSYLENIFFKYNFVNEKLKFNNIIDFRKKYFKELSIDLDIDIDKSGNIKSKKIDYMLYFLENILLTSNFSNKINSTEIVNYFNDYIAIANYYYSNSNEKTKRIGIFTYYEILIKLNILIKEKYFNAERDNSGLLEIKNLNLVIKNEIKLLEKNINSIVEFYKNNLYTLKTKDNFITIKYSEIEKEYNEYFAALKDYNEYTIKYDKNKSKLLEINSINHNNNNNNNNIELSKENAINYLSFFKGINIESAKIKVMGSMYCIDPTDENEKLPLNEPYCYKIENMKVDLNNISFLLYPFHSNKLDEIYINNNKKNGSYKLDIIKDSLEDKKEYVSDSDTQYDFNLFFANKFGNKIITKNNDNINNDNINNDNINNDNIIEEEPIVKIFKRNKLLGEYGDFANLKGFLTINYNDLIVEKKESGDYSININESLFKTNIGDKINYTGLFSSNYSFTPKHSFINPKIKIQLIESNNKKDLLLGNYIYIYGEYKVNKIKDEFKDVFRNFNNIDYIIQKSKDILGENNIKVEYFKNSKLIKFNIPYKSSNINIILNNSTITEITYNNEKLINSSISYNKINTIFNTLK